MITKEDFLNLALNDENYRKARKKIKEYDSNVDFTVYSCNNDIIKRVLNANDDDELDTLVKYIKKSNAQETDINDIIIEEETKSNSSDAIEKFFKMFDDDSNKKRLFGIIGEAGVGKTTVVKQRFPNIVTYACNSSLDPYSLCYYLADKDGKGLKPHETPFLYCLRNGGKIYLDEFNSLPHDTKMFIQGITDEKDYIVIGDENIQIHDTFKIIATFNPPSETDERDPIGDALLSRAILYVMELTDEIIIDRLGVNQQWLTLVRKLHGYVRNSGLIDVRELNYRDYDNFANGYDFESVFKGKMCIGDITNIREFNKIQRTGEYQELLKEIKIEMMKS